MAANTKTITLSTNCQQCCCDLTVTATATCENTDSTFCSTSSCKPVVAVSMDCDSDSQITANNSETLHYTVDVVDEEYADEKQFQIVWPISVICSGTKYLFKSQRVEWTVDGVNRIITEEGCKLITAWPWRSGTTPSSASMQLSAEYVQLPVCTCYGCDGTIYSRVDISSATPIPQREDNPVPPDNCARRFDVEIWQKYAELVASMVLPRYSASVECPMRRRRPVVANQPPLTYVATKSCIYHIDPYHPECQLEETDRLYLMRYEIEVTFGFYELTGGLLRPSVALSAWVTAVLRRKCAEYAWTDPPCGISGCYGTYGDFQDYYMTPYTPGEMKWWGSVEYDPISNTCEAKKAIIDGNHTIPHDGYTGLGGTATVQIIWE